MQRAESPSAPAPKRSPAGWITLALAAAGGCSFSMLQVPAPWLLGSTLAVAISALAGAAVSFPTSLRDPVFLLLGVSLGSGISRAGMADLSSWSATLAALMAALAVSTVLSGAFLRSYAKWDRATAFFSSIPGNISGVLVTAAATSADTKLVALTQMLRMLVLMAILPLLTLVPIHVPPTQAIAAPDVWLIPSVVLEIGVGAGLSYGLKRAGVPASMLVGGMLSAGSLHYFGCVAGQMPSVIFIPCQLALGAFIGARFRGTDLSVIRKAIVPSTGAFLLTLAVSVIAALVMAWCLHLPVHLVLIAFAPGAIEMMAVLAFALGADPAFVAGHHLVRFIGLSFVLALASRHFASPSVRTH